MAVNFFQEQQNARKRTVRLLLLFVLAVMVLTLVTALCLAFFAPFLLGTAGIAAPELNDMLMNGHILQTPYLWFGLLLVPAVTFSASAYKLWQLSDGGHAVALSLGGTLLHQPHTHKERQLLNIVEEMAIAGGMSVPLVYVLQDEPAINAFTAGYRANDMVIGITLGALKTLTREEMQGVIAHEFGHMQSGDTRLNTLMIGVLYGISMISLIGMKLFNLSIWSSSPSDGQSSARSEPLSWKSSGSGSTSFGGILIVALFALCLIIIGSLGWFFAAMIKASICREREYLADAVAVQFTRNPHGLAGALKKIGGYSYNSYLYFSGRAMVEHMLFSYASPPRYEFTSHATHPPLTERIRRLEPRWDGNFPHVSVSTFDPSMSDDKTEKPAYDSVKTAQVLGITAVAPMVFPHAAQEKPGDLHHLDYAHGILATLPEDWLSYARNPDLSVCVLLTLLLSTDTAVARTQLEYIVQYRRRWSEGIAALTATRAKVTRAHRLPLIEIALPRISILIDDEASYAGFKKLLQDIIRADRQVSLFEWCAYTIASAHLKKNFTKSHINLYIDSVPKSKLLDAYYRLFSLMARYCNEGQDALAAFQIACLTAEIPVRDHYDADTRLSDLPKTLRTLNQLPVLEKPQLLRALVTLMRQDGQISPIERELLCAISIILDNPLPPLAQNTTHFTL